MRKKAEKAHQAHSAPMRARGAEPKQAPGLLALQAAWEGAGAEQRQSFRDWLAGNEL
jgi:hypothetical protein